VAAPLEVVLKSKNTEVLLLPATPHASFSMTQAVETPNTPMGIVMVLAVVVLPVPTQ